MDELKKRFMATIITSLLVTSATKDLPEEDRAALLDGVADMAAKELRESVANGTVVL